jgi:hypothetical protein
MTIEQKGRLIATIMRTLKATAKLQDKAFNEGDTFFALAFKSDSELERVAKLTFGEVQS